MGTLTEIDDYIRLLFAKVGDSYCWKCGTQIKPQTVDQIIASMRENYDGKRIYLLKENGTFATKSDLLKFVKNNKQKVEKGNGFFITAGSGELFFSGEGEWILSFLEL